VTGTAGQQEKTGPVAEPPAGDGAVWRSLLGGLIVAVVLAWFLLSAGLSLPFMLGLFFFMLFGLIVGAVMFRFGDTARPIAKSKVVMATALVSIACWAVALGKECVEFPADFVEKALRQVYIPPDGYDQVKGELESFITEYLKREYPPGGAIGYLRLAAAGKPIEVNIESQPKTVTVKPMTAAWVWWTRTVLSVVLFYLAAYSVTGDLSKRRKLKDAAAPENPPGAQTHPSVAE
jgi:hypothetical protein